MSDSHLKNVPKTQASSADQEQKGSPNTGQPGREQKPNVKIERSGNNEESTGKQEIKEHRVPSPSCDEPDTKSDSSSRERNPFMGKLEQDVKTEDASQDIISDKSLSTLSVKEEPQASVKQDSSIDEPELNVNPSPDICSSEQKAIENVNLQTPRVEEEQIEDLNPDSIGEQKLMKNLNTNVSSKQEPMKELNPDASSELEPMKDMKPDASSELELMKDLKPDASCEQESIEDLNTDAPFEQEAMEDLNPIADCKQEPKEDLDLVATCEQETMEDLNPDVSRDQEPIVDPNLVASSDKQELTEKMNPDASDGEQKPMEDLNPDASGGEKELMESIVPSSNIALGNIAGTSSTNPQETTHHVCVETCVHGGARPKTRNQTILPTNTFESTGHPDERILQNLFRLIEIIGRYVARNPPNANINQEDWNKKLENASGLTEELGRQVGYGPMIRMPENPNSPYLQAHGQLNRMFLSLSLNDEDNGTEPHEVGQCNLDPIRENPLEASANRGECNISDDQSSGSKFTSAGLEDSKANNDLITFEIPTDQNTQVPTENQDDKEQVQELEHQGDQVEVPEERNLENPNEIGVEENPVLEMEPAENPQPRQEYRLLRLAPFLPPTNQLGPICPNHPYRERRLDIWRAAMLTAYRSERFHSPELLDATMSRLEGEGISRNEFYRLYHSTRLIDSHRDEGVDENRTFSELQDIALEDRINQIIIAFGYMTVAMLYMHLYTERNSEVKEDSTESSTVDSGNPDSVQSEPNIQYVPLKEHVTIDPECSSDSDPNSNDRKFSQVTSNSSTDNDQYDNSPTAINSPATIDSPPGIQSPDFTAPPTNLETNRDTDLSLLVPLKEVPICSDTSSSRQSLLNMGDMFDADSSSSQTTQGAAPEDSSSPQAAPKKGSSAKRKTILGRGFSEESTSHDAASIPSDTESPRENPVGEESHSGQGDGGLVNRTGGDLLNLLMDALLPRTLDGAEGCICSHGKNSGFDKSGGNSDPESLARCSAPQSPIEDSVEEEVGNEGKSTDFNRNSHKGQAQKFTFIDKIGISGPQGQVGVSAAQGKLQSSEVQSQVESSAVQGQAESSAVQGQAESSAVQGQAESSAVQGQAASSAVQGQAASSIIHGHVAVYGLRTQYAISQELEDSTDYHSQIGYYGFLDRFPISAPRNQAGSSLAQDQAGSSLAQDQAGSSLAQDQAGSSLTQDQAVGSAAQDQSSSSGSPDQVDRSALSDLNT